MEVVCVETAAQPRTLLGPAVRGAGAARAGAGSISLGGPRATPIHLQERETQERWKKEDGCGCRQELV